MKTEWKTCAIKTKAVTTRLQSKILNQTRKLWELTLEILSLKSNINISKTLKEYLTEETNKHWLKMKNTDKQNTAFTTSSSRKRFEKVL